MRSGIRKSPPLEAPSSRQARSPKVYRTRIAFRHGATLHGATRWEIADRAYDGLISDLYVDVRNGVDMVTHGRPPCVAPRRMRENLTFVSGNHFPTMNVILSTCPVPDKKLALLSNVLADLSHERQFLSGKIRKKWKSHIRLSDGQPSDCTAYEWETAPLRHRFARFATNWQIWAWVSRNRDFGHGRAPKGTER